VHSLMCVRSNIEVAFFTLRYTLTLVLPEPAIQRSTGFFTVTAFCGRNKSVQRLRERERERERGRRGAVRQEGRVSDSRSLSVKLKHRKKN